MKKTKSLAAVNEILVGGGRLGDTDAIVMTGVNVLINPNFVVNQTNYAGGNIVNGGYCYDMWQSQNGDTDNGVTVSGETITLQANAELEQINEDLIAQSGGEYTISVESGSVDVSGGGIGGTVNISPGSAHTFTLAVIATDGIKISNGTFSGLQLNKGDRVGTYTIPNVTIELLKC